jgi:hypothetical protein
MYLPTPATVLGDILNREKSAIPNGSRNGLGERKGKSVFPGRWGFLHRMSHELVSGTNLRRKSYTTDAFILASEVEIIHNNG